ncbi:hypothetical protein [Alicyclobacillus dauci]|uniref:Bacteriophage/plasmid primase P4 C-terminal domain-containing protein n=1 Tax=Alicyclobacillus dauci TaxID=1475485 RepID=A0ABY6Z8N0_9BACL|nr:hypothetical protein [Alicyclobacillus dauci]WAH39085.1 hypothetical protein NZD86_00125 [Alicyclobacillus dauci]
MTTLEIWEEEMTEDMYEQWLEQAIESAERNQQAQDEFWELIDVRNMGYQVDKDRLGSLARHVFCGDEKLVDEHINGTYFGSGSSSDKSEIQADPQKYFLNKSFSPVLLGRDIIDNYLQVFSDGNVLYRYDKGVYKQDGDREFENLTVKLLGTWWKGKYLTESLTWTKKATVPSQSEYVNPNDGLINVANGLLNWNTGELLPHTPERLGTIQLPVMYDPTANDPVVKEFLCSVMPEDAVDTLLEMIGYCLVTHTKYEKAIMLIGSGANGKSTVINLLTALIGQVNSTNISLQDLETHRFKIASSLF